MHEKRALVSVVMPCLNEEEAVGECVGKIREIFDAEKICGEIIVCDNGSTDRSIEIAKKAGARIVHQPLHGYGNAYLMGFASAAGDYLIMIDADDTYDAAQIPELLKKLSEEKYDFVTGSRYLKASSQEEIPFLHRYFGNPLLTRIVNFLFGTHYTDVYSGFRAFTRHLYDRIMPVSPGMEFNLELAINAHLVHARIAEISTRLKKRKGRSKLRTFRDGWRSLRMMLLYCPQKIFFLPGLALCAAGVAAHSFALFGIVKFAGRPAGTVTSIFGIIFTVIGFQIINLGLHVNTYSWVSRFQQQGRAIQRFYKIFTLEIGIAIGSTMTLSGCAILLYLFRQWIKSGLLPFARPEFISFAATLVIIGTNIIFSSLFISAMAMKVPRKTI